MSKQKNIGGEVPTNGAKKSIEMCCPYQISVKIEGIADLLFHRWNCEAVEYKANAKRGSDVKKQDDLETYVYRNDKQEICIPSEYLRMSIIQAAKFQTDPRSTRKTAMDLFKAAIVSLNPLSSLKTKKWDYEDKRKVNIQRSGINRVRPAMHTGWEADFNFMINIPEYITPSFFNEVIQTAGKLVGIGDFRPTFGRFQVVEFKLVA